MKMNIHNILTILNNSKKEEEEGYTVTMTARLLRVIVEKIIENEDEISELEDRIEKLEKFAFSLMGLLD